jgi:hypothetical protein
MRRTMMLQVVALLALTGCGGFTLSPVSPAAGVPGSVRATMPITAVNVSVAPEMNADQQQVLAKYRVAAEMQRVLGLSLNAGQPGGATVNVVLTSIRHSSFGPSRMHSTTTVVGPDQGVLKTFEAESVTMRSKALKRVAQDHVQKVADGV